MAYLIYWYEPCEHWGCYPEGMTLEGCDHGPHSEEITGPDYCCEQHEHLSLPDKTCQDCAKREREIFEYLEDLEKKKAAFVCEECPKLCEADPHICQICPPHEPCEDCSTTDKKRKQSVAGRIHQIRELLKTAEYPEREMGLLKALLRLLEFQHQSECEKCDAMSPP